MKTSETTTNNKNNPGRNPCLNKSIGLIPAVTEYIIAGKLGGKRSPKDPDAVISPREKTSEYPSSTKIGYNIAPRANIVTPEPPVNAVKNAHNNTTINTVDPGSQPRDCLKKSNNLFEILLSARI